MSVHVLESSNAHLVHLFVLTELENMTRVAFMLKFKQWQIIAIISVTNGNCHLQHLNECDMDRMHGVVCSDPQ